MAEDLETTIYSEEEKQDISRSLNIKKIKRKFIEEVHHNLNPMNAPYCRLCDLLDYLGKHDIFFQNEKRNKKIAQYVCTKYEKIVYQTFFNNGHGDSRIRKCVRKLLKTPSNILSYARKKKNRFS